MPRSTPNLPVIGTALLTLIFLLLLLAAGRAVGGVNEPQWSTDTGGDVKAVALSDNGRYLASGSVGGQLYLYDMENPDEPLIDFSSAADINDVALSADGRWLVTGTADNFTYLFDRDRLPTNDLPVASYEANSTVISVDIVPNGSRYAAGTSLEAPYEVLLFDNGDQTPYRTEQLQTAVVHLALSDDGSALFVGANSYLYYFTTDAGDSSYEWREYLGSSREDPGEVAISADGELVVAGINNGETRLYNASGGQQWTVSSGFAPINAVAMTPTAQRILVGDSDGYVWLYDAEGDKLFEHQAERDIFDVALSDDGRRFVAGSWDKRVYHYYPEEQSGVYWHYEADRQFVTVALSSDGEWTAAGSTDDRAYYFDAQGVANRQPVAVIDSIDPSPALVGEEITFDGSSSNDPDGSLAAYEWTSDLDGLLSTSATFSRDNLSQGDHTITLKVRDENGAWSEPTTWDLAVHTAPTATIDEIDPNPAHTGKQVTFAGTGSDDGTIEEYLWESDQLVDPLGTTASFTYTFDESGTHTITFKVRDNNGQWSEAATQRLDVLEPVNERPTAVILSLTPAAPQLGDEVTLQGRGEDSDGSILNYQWSSNRNGDLGNTATVTTTLLVEGVHTLSFRVQDDDYVWSEPVTATLEIKPRLVAVLMVRPATGDTEATFTFQAEDSEGAITGYFYDFGDDENSGWVEQAFVTHDYAEAGSYTVTLRVRDAGQRESDPAPQTLVVTEPQTPPPDTSGDGDSQDTPAPGLAAAALALVLAARWRRQSRQPR